MKSMEKTNLSLKDMTKLVALYDAVKELHIALFGEVVVFPVTKGVLGALSYVFDVISNGICAEFKQLNEEEVYQKISSILDDTDMSPGQRAEKLLGMD